MSKENLESIVQNMVDDGVSEEDIASAINQYDLDEKANKSSSKVDKRWGKKDNLTDIGSFFDINNKYGLYLNENRIIKNLML